MVRRWSHLITINFNFYELIKIQIKYLFFIFKKSIIFRKFYTKRTKFKRRSLYKLKHKSSWIIYSQIFKYWVLDYKIYKLYFKYQYGHKMFLYGFLSSNKNTTKSHKFKNIENLNYFFYNFLPKIYFYYFNNNKSKNFYKNLEYDYTYVIDKSEIKNLLLENLTTHVIGIKTNNNLISFNYTKLLETFSFSTDYLYEHNQLLLKQIIQYYHILSLLWLFFILKS